MATKSKSKSRPSRKRATPDTKQGGFFSRQVPLYYQLATVLRENILSGRFSPGEQLPTEAKLVERYGVSRITVRQALRLLVDEKLIRREVGRGTFVSDTAIPKHDIRINLSIDDLISLGEETSVSLIDFRHISAPGGDARSLNLEPGSKVTRITRLRYYEDRPYSLIVNVLPYSIGQKLTEAYLRKGSVLKFLEDKMKIELKDARQIVEATLADATLAGLLDLRVGDPILAASRVVESRAKEPVELVRSYYRGDQCSVEIYVRRHAPSRRTARQWLYTD